MQVKEQAEMMVFQRSGFISVSLVRQHNASLSEQSKPELTKIASEMLVPHSLGK